jgi:hypothetical protein
MRKQWLVVSLVCGLLLLHACGGGPPAATQLLVTIAQGAATAGTALTINVSAVDATGKVVPGYNGTVQFTSTDPKAVLPNGALTNGTGTFMVTLKTAGSESITATSGSLTGTLSSITVSPAVVAALSITTASNSPTAGSAFNITVNAVDAYNNVTPSYTGTVHFISTDSQATLPGNMTLTNGTGTFSVTLKTAGIQTITATDTVTASITGGSNPITVNAGPLTALSLQAPSAVTTGIAFSVTVNATDAYGNVVASYTGTVHFTSTDSQATLPANSMLTSGTGSFSVTLKTIAAQTITATDTITATLKGTSSGINVVSNAATHLGFVGTPSSTDTRQTFQFTVSALDAANNVSVGYSGTVHFSSSDSQAKLPANTTLTAGTLGGLSATFETAGPQTLTATDTTTSSITGFASISVTAAPGLVISSGAPPTGTVGSAYNYHSVLVCYYFYYHKYCHYVYVTGYGLTGTGGVPPYNWSWAPATGSSLPPGLSVVSSGNPTCTSVWNNIVYHPACIYGTPTQPGTYNVVVTVTDSGLPAVQTTASYTITINLPPPPVVKTTPPPPPGVENQPYTYTFTASGYPPFTWSESGALPTGLTFDSSTATLSGTPTQTGSFPITVTATDQFKQSSAATAFTIVVSAHGFVATGSMGTARRFHTATLLGNGKVLVAGGEDAGATAFASAELYDPSTGTFSPTGSMTAPRVGHTATLLSNGKVLITGGATDATENALSSAELYDPVAGTFSATGSMTTARVVHTATLLSNGTVLITGGDGIFFNGVQNTSIKSLDSAEIFDPSTGMFTATGNMTAARETHTATLLGDGSGRVLIAGGSDGAVGNTTPAATIYATAELFDPSKGTFSAAGMMTSERDFFTPNLLSSGKVLAAGGVSSTGTLNTADLFDPTSTNFAATGNLTATRFYHDATTLSDGTVLLCGGSDANDRALSSAEIYDPTAGTFAVTGSMISPRVWHTATLLPNGKVLVTGGEDNNSSLLATAELYQ